MLKLAGLEALVLTEQSNFVNIGERTNVTVTIRICAAGGLNTSRAEDLEETPSPKIQCHMML